MPQPGQTTIALADLRTDVRQRTDTENDPHISDGELTRWIRSGYGALYDQLISMWGEDFFVSKSALIATNGADELYPLPADHYKNLLCEVQNQMGLVVNGASPAWITVHPFALRDKNRYNLVNFASYFGYINVRYRIEGSSVMFAPLPQGGQNFRLWYAPRLVPLADVGYVALKGVGNGDGFTINGVTFTAGSNFAVGASDADTATNLALAINTIIGNGTLPGVVVAQAGPTTSPTAYQGAEGPLVVPARPGTPANVVAITIYNASVTWSTPVVRISLVPGPQGARADATVSPTTYTWSDVVDGVSEWWELVSCDAALKVLGKQERDASLVAAQRAEAKVRLERAAPNRNIGDPATVVETGGDSPFPGSGLGWPGGNSW